VVILLMLSELSWSDTLADILIRDSFHKTFHHKCSRYPFVEQFWKNLDNPSSEFVEFVYHEAGLKNGGFGDRLGGLITAAAIALRLNRTLVIKSGNGFGDYFRPYHRPTHGYVSPASEIGPQRQYTYTNYSMWTNFNFSQSSNDETELDLWNCINMNGKVNDVCGLDYAATVPQPIIKLRSNRCYLCKWMSQDRPAQEQLRRILGLSEASNLYEVGGCLLRLAMWPTDLLFSKLAKVYSNDLQLVQTTIRRLQSSVGGAGTEVSSKPVLNEVNGINIHHLHTHRHHVFTAHQHHLPILIGMHFRCGDWSYIKGRSVDDTCKHDVTKNASDYKELGESDYMRFGTPADIGRCGKQIIANITATFDELKVSSTDTAQTSQFAKSLDVIVHIASDNPGSAAQMKEYVDWKKSFTSPFGCHVDRDTTQECTEKTIIYWMLLAMSDFIVTQVENGTPISGFSRFAGIYGLKGDSIVTAIDCKLESFQEMGWKKNGNWACG
jgi:hypothetical protein